MTSRQRNPVTLMVPKLTLNHNTRGIVSATEADGSELFVEAMIFSSDAKNTIEPPSPVRPAAEPNEFVDIGAGNDGHGVGVPIAEVREYAKEHGISEKEAGKRILSEMAQAETKRKDDAGQAVPKAEK